MARFDEVRGAAAGAGSWIIYHDSKSQRLESVTLEQTRNNSKENVAATMPINESTVSTDLSHCGPAGPV